jgi:3-oxoacyl-[acyl-carrier-protein] synthase III
MKSVIKNFKISAMALSTGSITKSYIEDGLARDIPCAKLERTSKTIGLNIRKTVTNNITTLDLCEDASRRLLKIQDVDIASLDAIIFVTQTPDFSQPNNASLLHGRLGLNDDVMAYDISVGCSGWVYGLHQAAMLCAHSGLGRVLLCAGDTLSQLTHPQDQSIDPIFCDAGSATLVERSGEGKDVYFMFGTVGGMSSAIKVPAGGAREPFSLKTKNETKDEFGNINTPENLQMNGVDVFNFTLREVPQAIRSVMALANYSISEVDALVLHQANKFVVQTIAQNTGFDLKNVPNTVFEKYGNQSSASIPCVLIDSLGSQLSNKSMKVVTCGYGVGLSWAAFAGEIGPIALCPVQPYPRP